jgi:hypothetical protein
VFQETPIFSRLVAERGDIPGYGTKPNAYTAT